MVLGFVPQRAACRALALSVVFSSPALAQVAGEPSPAELSGDALPVLVHYQAPEPCPSQTLFEGALLFRLPRVGLVASEERAAVSARVRIDPAADGSFQGLLELAPRDGAPSERTIRGKRCATVVEALSLAAALLLDPEGVRTAPLPSVSELESLAEKARAATEPEPVAPEPKPAPPPAPPAKPPPAAPPPPPPVATDSDGGWRSGLALFGGATNIVHGVDAQAGLAAEFALRTGGIEFGPLLAMGLGLEHRVDSPVGSVTYEPFELRLGACLNPTNPRVELGACAGAALLRLAVNAPEADVPRPSVRTLANLWLGPRFAYLVGRFAIGAELAGGIHLSAERFRIEPEGEVFRLPRIFGRSMIFLRFDASLADRDPGAGFGG